MKKTILPIALTFLICLMAVDAIQIAVDCNGTTTSPGIDATTMCNDNTSIVTISYYLTDVTVADNLDLISVRLDYNNSLLAYSSSGLNEGINRSEFIESAGGTGRASKIEIDNNTVDTSATILGDCTVNGTCPTGNGNVLKITFNCVDSGTVYCSGTNPSLAIVDTRNISTTYTMWMQGDAEYGGKKQLFNVTPQDTSKFHIRNSSGNSVAWFGNFGNIVLKGTLTQNTTPTPTANDEFRFQDSNNNDVMIVDQTNGSMYIKGFLYENQDTLTPSEQSDDFIIKNSSNDVVAYVNESGYIFLKGKLYENSNP